MLSLYHQSRPWLFDVTSLSITLVGTQGNLFTIAQNQNCGSLVTFIHLTDLLEKLEMKGPQHLTASPVKLKRVAKELKDIRVPEGVLWSTKEDYEDKRREVSVSDTRRGSVVYYTGHNYSANC